MTDKKLTIGLAVKAKCWDCVGYYYDGMKDCENTQCPLYKWMPYRKKEPALDWLKYNPRRKGHVTWEESSRPMTDEQKAEARERLKKAREAQKEKAEK